ncbi:MAG TPA: tripartite tricarboxylate transporter substrate binding protein, partial [Ramlibacter sp.]
MHEPTTPSTIDRRRRRLVAALGAASVGGFPAVVAAQARRLTIVLTVPPGTSSDVLARTLGEQVRVKLNRTVIV